MGILLLKAILQQIDFYAVAIKHWWRRRESNPRPKILALRYLQVQFTSNFRFLESYERYPKKLSCKIFPSNSPRLTVIRYPAIGAYQKVQAPSCRRSSLVYQAAKANSDLLAFMFIPFFYKFWHLTCNLSSTYSRRILSPPVKKPG